MLDSAPMDTSPIITAVSAIKAEGAILGCIPLNERIISGFLLALGKL
jgi:hypothetical protein